MTVDELADEIAARPPASKEKVTLTNVEELLPADEAETLSMALVILEECGDLFDELLQRPKKQRKLSDLDICELQQASDTIYDFLATSDEDWEDTK